MITLQVFETFVDDEAHLGLACITGSKSEDPDGTKYAELNVKAVLIPRKRRARQVNGEARRVTQKKAPSIPE